MEHKEKSGGVLGKRDAYLSAMRQKTFESGFFTASDVAHANSVPRTTAQDWINRLLKEGCIFMKDKAHGRYPAHYASRSAMPMTTCRRIFTTVDGFDVEIFHECLSSGCAGFCEFHHKRAGGAAISVYREGMIFRERAKIGYVGSINLKDAAVGLVSVKKDKDEIVQTIKSINGGTAYSLSSMMGLAKGVCSVKIDTADGLVTGEVRTKALIPLTIGIDDTDKKGCGGATFALSQALMKYLTESGDAIGIRHQVAVLYQGVNEKTVGNSCSFIEIAIEPKVYDSIINKIIRFVEDESLSKHWGVAVMKGISVPSELLVLGDKIRHKRVSLNEVLKICEKFKVLTFGDRGIIGAVAAVSLKNQPQEVLLDLSNNVVN